MDESLVEKLNTVANLLRVERRKYNNLLKDVVEGRAEEYNSEDLMRLCGTLEAAYNHALASLAADGDIYCLLKHVSYAIILVGELDRPDTEPLYTILAVLTEGAVSPCGSCHREETNAIIEEKEDYGNDNAD